MQRRAGGLWVLAIAVTASVAIALLVGRPEAKRKSRTVASIPQLGAEAKVVSGWVDRGLLSLAEQSASSADEVTRAYDPGAADASLGGAAEPPLAEPMVEPASPPETLAEQRDRLYRTWVKSLGLGAEQLARLRRIIDASLYFGEGNPSVTVHPMTRAECVRRRSEARTFPGDARICGGPNMVALYDPDKEEPKDAKLCMDQFEFPNLPCEYPIVWVRANEAAELCRMLDKRLCDAHEWEGACAGRVRSPSREYESWVYRQLSELLHNQSREWTWATGVKPDRRLCATGALKSDGCVDASFERCGTNSYPAGAFPRCVSPFGVYDLHGNVAEHMNLPTQESQLGARGGSGETEMKGSWFAFDEYHPHPDDCRWRAPSWHSTPLESELSHYNYHLGFRCCRDLE